MDGQTGLVLALQLIALCSIAGALLLYLLCKVRGGSINGTTQAPPVVMATGGGAAVLVTSADTALGLQISTHLASRGYKVFAGLKDPVDSVAAKLLRNWLKAREMEMENSVNPNPSTTGTIIPLHIDVTREDVLRESSDCVAGHLPAGERGIRGVINTAGVVHKGRVEHQDTVLWENMLRTNVLGCVRAARVFTQLLRPTRGRFLTIGGTPTISHPQPLPSDLQQGEGLVVYSACLRAIEGLTNSLRSELGPCGVDVIQLRPDYIKAEKLYGLPQRNNVVENRAGEQPVAQYTASVLGPNGLRNIERALCDLRPQEFYSLAENKKNNLLMWGGLKSPWGRKTKKNEQGTEAPTISV
ncbi:D-beta-hydroxybutyrate dehydrogenase, mitochondrial-like [Ctenocephalides felis]|uniref:D-beta-hydroxybutyrate dehydrogenase, mitochondrial-like n=1 Tax=Ctenocephalides felis TaxID=7515 RepID=UPI000E6E2DA0|nr:D-beta-hydroxybutyrate dehydrogenase, mitochondrial-like [Ctenocephalides felis]